jgi:hypothetical protein
MDRENEIRAHTLHDPGETRIHHPVVPVPKAYVRDMQVNPPRRLIFASRFTGRFLPTSRHKKMDIELRVFGNDLVE